VQAAKLVGYDLMVGAVYRYLWALRRAAEIPRRDVMLVDLPREIWIPPLRRRNRIFVGWA
jgi:hypothetical protein